MNKSAEFLVEMELGLGYAIAIFDECQVQAPEGHPDPLAIHDCINNVRDAYVTLKKYMTSVSTKANGEAEGVEDVNREAMKVLESLTPGGSEYYNDPSACANFIKGNNDFLHRNIVKLTLENKELKGQAAQFTPKEAPQVAVECYEKLIEAQDRYIGFLSKAFNQVYSIAHVHHYRSSGEEIKEGQRLRDQIEQLKETTLYTTK